MLQRLKVYPVCLRTDSINRSKGRGDNPPFCAHTTPAIKYPEAVIPVKAGIQEHTGCGMCRGIMRKCRPWPYEELAHIVLMVRTPGVGEGKRVSSFVQSCDVAPTIVDYMNIRSQEVKHGEHALPVCADEEMQGLSLLPLIRGEKEKLRDFAIAGYYGFSWSIIRDDYSFIHWLTEEQEAALDTVMKMYDGGGMGRGEITRDMQDEDMWTCTPGSEAQIPEWDEMYDRRTDPFQLNNIIDRKPEKAKELLQQLKHFMGELRTT